MKILLAEDDRVQSTLYAFALEKWGYTVQATTDGEEALRFLMSDPNFNTLISDFNMPRMNGIELIFEMKQRRIFPSAIILFSGTALKDILSDFPLPLTEVQNFHFIHKDQGIAAVKDLLQPLRMKIQELKINH